ncbi:MAG: glycosyltransferase, partial [Planctomycetota bacterium]
MGLRVAVDITAILTDKPSSRYWVAHGLHKSLPQALAADERLIFAWKLSRFRSRKKVERIRAPNVRYRPYVRELASLTARADVFHCLRRGGPERYGGPVISTVHSLDSLAGTFRQAKPGENQEAGRPKDGLIFLTAAARTEYLKAFPTFPEDRAFVCPNGFDPGIFTATKQPGDDKILEDLGLTDRPYVVCVATVEKRKNQGRLCEAFSMASSARGMDLVLIGKDLYQGPEMRELGQRWLGERARFLGQQPRDFMPAIYRGARAFALPSLYEEQGLVFLEAMASGIPSLGPDLDTTRELFAGAMEFRDPTSVGELAEGIEAILS